MEHVIHIRRGDRQHEQICHMERFIEKLAKLNKPTVAVHFDGRPISSNADNYIDTILEAWSPVSTVQSDHRSAARKYNPAGRLPVTVARNSGQILFIITRKRVRHSYRPGIAFNSYVDGPREPRYCLATASIHKL